jgi:hypothetical protein
MHANGTVKNQQKVGATDGNFHGDVDHGNFLGVSVSPLGDLDGDQLMDIAMGSLVNSVWVLFLNPCSGFFNRPSAGACETTYRVVISGAAKKNCSQTGTGEFDIINFTQEFAQVMQVPEENVDHVAGGNCSDVNVTVRLKITEFVNPRKPVGSVPNGWKITVLPVATAGTTAAENSSSLAASEASG